LFLSVLWYFSFKNCLLQFLEGQLFKTKSGWDGNSIRWSICLPIGGRLLGWMVNKNLDDYMGERCYDSSISKRKKGLHGESAQRELGEHDIMLDGIFWFDQLCEQVKEDRQKYYHWRAKQNTLYNNCDTPKNGTTNWIPMLMTWQIWCSA